MSTVAAAMPSKKRAASDAAAAACQVSKKAANMTLPAAGSLAGVPGWQYPALPMGMMPPMPYCMPGNPFFPFMGMFPPFWLPAAAMAAAAMPALAAASAANATGAAAIPGAAGLMAQPCASMWPMLPFATAVQPILAATASVPAPARASSGVSSAAAFPSTSCTNSVPAAGAVRSPPSPPPVSASPVSVCNGGLQPPPEDDEFADFIDSILLSGDQDPLLRCQVADLSEPSTSDLFEVCDFMSTDGSNCSEITTDEDPCLTRSDSHSLLSLLGPDISFPGL